MNFSISLHSNEKTEVRATIRRRSDGSRYAVIRISDGDVYPHADLFVHQENFGRIAAMLREAADVLDPTQAEKAA